MVKVFNIWEYSFIFSEKTNKLKSIFIEDTQIKVSKFILWAMSDDLFQYCLESSWLTMIEPNKKIFNTFTNLLELNKKWFELDDILNKLEYEKA